MSEDDGLKAMGQVIQIDEARIRDHLGEMVRGTVEETLNALLDAEARDALDKAPAGVGNDQLHALQAAVDQMAQKRRPAGFVLLGAFADPQDLAKPSELTAEATSSETLRTSPAQLRFMTMPSR